MMTTKCDFCSKKIYEAQGIVENEVARVLYPLKPACFGHLMIITKRHVGFFTDLTDDEVIGIKDLVSQVTKVFFNNECGSGYNILNNNGAAADQHLSHFHLHLFIRKENEVSPFDILSGKISANFNDDKRTSDLARIRTWFS